MNHKPVRKKSEEGFYLIFLPFLIVAFIMVGGLCVDFSNLSAQRATLQRSLDATLLGSARLALQGMDETTLRARAQDLLSLNVTESGLSAANVEPFTHSSFSYDSSKGLLSGTTRLKVRTQFLKLASGFFSIPDWNSVPATARAQVRPANLVMVIDVSPSMGAAAYPNDPTNLDSRLDKVKESAKKFMGMLAGEQHYVSIVSMATYTEVELPPTLTDGPGRTAIRAAIDGLSVVSGMTNITAGLDEAERQLLAAPAGDRARAVLAFTDGAPNITSARLAAADVGPDLPASVTPYDFGGAGTWNVRGVPSEFRVAFEAQVSGDLVKGYLRIYGSPVHHISGNATVPIPPSPPNSIPESASDFIHKCKTVIPNLTLPLGANSLALTQLSALQPLPVSLPPLIGATCHVSYTQLPASMTDVQLHKIYPCSEKLLENTCIPRAKVLRPNGAPLMLQSAARGLPASWLDFARLSYLLPILQTDRLRDDLHATVHVIGFGQLAVESSDEFQDLSDNGTVKKYFLTRLAGSIDGINQPDYTSYGLTSRSDVAKGRTGTAAVSADPGKITEMFGNVAIQLMHPRLVG